jgi:hypothetical protein
VAFEQRQARIRGAGRGRDSDRLASHAAALAAERLGQPLEADLALEEDIGEVLHSATATMMTSAARDILLSGSPEDGLEAYKERAYRKMNARSPEDVRLISLR